MKMPKIGFGLLLSVILLTLMPVTVLAQAQSQGVIQGLVVNKTPNGKGVADISLEMKTFSGDQEKGTASAKTNAQGKFQFTGLSTEPSLSYQVSFTYQEADYTSDKVTFAPGETNKVTQVVVWDATDTDPGIKISKTHFVVQFQGDDLEITEYYKIENPGDKTYVGSKPVPKLDKKETLRFNLPAGAQIHQYALSLMESYISLENGALIDTMAVPPGGREIAFIYSTKFSSPSHIIPIAASLPTDQFSLVVEDKGIQVSSPQLSTPQRSKMENLPVLILNGGNLKKGDIIQATLSGLPTTTSTGSNIRFAGIALIVVALGFGVSYAILRRKRAAPVKVSHEDEKGQLLEEVARLDDSFESGLINKDEYTRLRASKMAHLVALSRRPQ